MLEILILYSLVDKNLTTYGIRKNILENFEIFYKPSLGAIHPALVKLIKNGYVEVTSEISDGGQKSVFHHLLPAGKKYFYQCFSEITTNTPAKIVWEVITKIVMLPKINVTDVKNEFFENALNILELTKYDIKNRINNNSDGYFQTASSLFYKEVNNLISMIEQLKKENKD